MVEDQEDQRATQCDIDSLSFEQALDELEEIVQCLEQGSAPLEESVSAYQRGEALRMRCETLLAKAQGEVEKITRAQDDTHDKAQADKTFERQKLASLQMRGKSDDNNF